MRARQFCDDNVGLRLRNGRQIGVVAHFVTIRMTRQRDYPYHAHNVQNAGSNYRD